MEPETTVVIFRKWSNGDILALFPEIPADNIGYECSAYEHIGQHGAANYGFCIQSTKPASISEAKELKQELEQIGYCLKVCERATAQHRANRQNNARCQRRQENESKRKQITNSSKICPDR
jgi:hypothetical protein